MKLSRTLLCLVIAGVVVATACGGDGDDGESPAAGGQTADEGSQQPAAEPTQVAFLDSDANQLVVFEDGAVHPVRDFPDGDWPGSVTWSADASRLVATDDETLFVWSGPDAAPDDALVEAPCDRCEATFVEGPSGEEVVAAIGYDDVITHLDPDTLQTSGTVEQQLPVPDEPTALHGDAGGRLVVAHAGSARSSGPDTLSLVDPLSGEEVARHGADRNVGVSAVAVDASGDRIAYVGGQPDEPCGHTDEVYLLDGDSLTEAARVAMPLSDDGYPQVEDLFFNGDALYATMLTYDVAAGGGYCEAVGSAGLWRLDAGGATWEQVDPRPLALVRPVEGLTNAPHTGMVSITEDAQGTFEPTGGSAAEALDLGSNVSGLWAPPTRDEVDLTGAGSSPSATNPAGDETDAGTQQPGGDGPAPDTTESAIARYEQFLHALGEGDIDTICEIAGPAAQRAENEGLGPCEETFGLVVDEMISPEHAEALRTATVDPSRVETTRTAGEPPEVHIPVEAVVASVTFTESDLGDVTLAYVDDNWHIVD